MIQHVIIVYQTHHIAFRGLEVDMRMHGMQHVNRGQWLPARVAVPFFPSPPCARAPVIEAEWMHEAEWESAVVFASSIFQSLSEVINA